VSVCWSQLWAIQKRLNQSRCRLVCGNGWAQGIRIRWGEPTLQGKGHFLKEHVGLQYSSVAGVVLLSFYFWSSVSLQIEMYVLLPICFIILGLLFFPFYYVFLSNNAFWIICPICTNTRLRNVLGHVNKAKYMCKCWMQAERQEVTWYRVQRWRSADVTRRQICHPSQCRRRMTSSIGCRDVVDVVFLV